MFYFLTDKQIAVYFDDGTSQSWESTHNDFAEIVKNCKEENWPEIVLQKNTLNLILNEKNKVTFNNNKLTIETPTGKVFNNLKLIEKNQKLVNFIKLLQEKGIITENIEEIKSFVINLLENPYIDALTEVYEFCKAGDFEITKEGTLLAYKKVNIDLTSIYDNKTKHEIGEYTTVSNFNTNRSDTCSTGLHFCSKSYLNHYGTSNDKDEEVIIVEINPKDIVSIPIDYNFSKGRCSKYKTIGILGFDGDLSTTNVEELSNNTVKVVKTKGKKKKEKRKAHVGIQNRVIETASLMDLWKNDTDKVAKIMNISKETVKRNMRKYLQKD